MPVIIDNDIVIVADAEISVSGEAAGYPKANVMNLDALMRRFRADNVTKSDSVALMVFDLGSAKTLPAVVLDYVNFDTVVIRGHDTDLSGESDGWDSASFDSGELSVGQETQTGRRKIYAALTGFNYRWLAILVPASATAVGSYVAAWEIGRVALMDSAYEFAQNMAYGYTRGASQSFKELKFWFGRVERSSAGILRWSADLPFGLRSLTKESDLTRMNQYSMIGTVVFYENLESTADVYICNRDTNYSGSWKMPTGVTGKTIRFTEKI